MAQRQYTDFPSALPVTSTYRHLLLTDQGPVLTAHQLGRACCPGCGQPWTRQSYLETRADGQPSDGGAFSCDACRIGGVLGPDDAFTAWKALVGIDPDLDLHTFLLAHVDGKDYPPPPRVWDEAEAQALVEQYFMVRLMPGGMDVVPDGRLLGGRDGYRRAVADRWTALLGEED